MRAALFLLFRSVEARLVLLLALLSVFLLLCGLGLFPWHLDVDVVAGLLGCTPLLVLDQLVQRLAVSASFCTAQLGHAFEERVEADELLRLLLLPSHGRRHVVPVKEPVVRIQGGQAVEQERPVRQPLTRVTERFAFFFDELDDFGQHYCLRRRVYAISARDVRVRRRPDFL